MSKQEQIVTVLGDVMIPDKAFSSNFISTDNVVKVDYIKSNVYRVLIKEDSVLLPPTELTPGIDYMFIFKQDSVGNHAVTFDSKFKFVILFSFHSKGK